MVITAIGRPFAACSRQIFVVRARNAPLLTVTPESAILVVVVVASVVICALGVFVYVFVVFAATSTVFGSCRLYRRLASRSVLLPFAVVIADMLRC